jgi:hypothetical protein
MTNRNRYPTGTLGVRQSSIAHSTSSERTSAGKITSILMALLLSPTLAFGYPFQLNWTDMNADEDGTIIYREISGVFHEVGFVDRNVTSFTDDPPGSGGDTFCWIVRAFREGEISGSSNETCASVPTTSSNPRPSKIGQREGQRR